MRRNDKAIMDASLMQSIFDEAPVCRLQPGHAILQ